MYIEEYIDFKKLVNDIIFSVDINKLTKDLYQYQKNITKQLLIDYKSKIVHLIEDKCYITSNTDDIDIEICIGDSNLDTFYILNFNSNLELTHISLFKNNFKIYL